MATKKTTKKKKRTAAAKTSQEVVMWLRLPRPMKVEELTKLGLHGADCFGGDTCIVASNMSSGGGIVVGGDVANLQESLKKAGLSRRADPCFGGDTCIV